MTGDAAGFRRAARLASAGEGFFEAVDEFGGAEGVAEEHSDGHGADAAGDGGDVRGFLFDGVEVDVAYGFAGAIGLLEAVDADVDDDDAFTDVVGGDEVRLADGDDDDVSGAAGGGRILGENVAEGDGGVAFCEEQ